MLSAQRRFQTSLLLAFAGIALVLASVGIYGLMRYSVATRRREIGIRMAVGADRAAIVRMILREGLSLSLIGLCVGLVGAAWLGQASLRTRVWRRAVPIRRRSSAVSALLTSVAAAACLPSLLAAPRKSMRRLR
jgi:putative ABC transport system permease protein